MPQGFEGTFPLQKSLANNLKRAPARFNLSNGQLIGHWVYALVAPFPTVQDDISSDELHAFWRGEEIASFKHLLISASDRAVLEQVWGPAPAALEVIPAEEILRTAWQSEDSWAIVPFEALQARWKLISVDGLSPIRKGLDPLAYALSLPLYLLATEEARALEALAPFLPLGNYRPEQLTTLIVTGVTAPVRRMAAGMLAYGPEYPGKDLAAVLSAADLLHICNEAPFASDCPTLNLPSEYTFCAPDEFMALLTSIGTDVVELTGDHLSDFGDEAVLHSLDLYAEQGWPVYGADETWKKRNRPCAWS